MSLSCVFCDIGRQPPGPNILHRDDVAFVVQDINPKAPVHLLVIPYEHITSMVETDESTVGHLILIAENMAKEKGISTHGYRLVVNQGQAARQEIAHLHVHLLGGRQLGAMG